MSARSTSEVVIVGGGIAGLSVALAARRRGLSVTVLERAVPGAEASTAAAGILGAQVEAHATGPALELGLLSRGLYPEWCGALEAETGVAIGLHRCGVAQVALDPTQWAELEHKADAQERLGLGVERRTGAALFERLPGLTREAVGALLFPEDGQVEPDRLLRALAIAAERLGVRFLTGQPVGRILVSRGRVSGVEVGSEVRLCERVVLCAGAWTSLLPDAGLAASAIRPTRGQLIGVTLRAPPFRPVVFGPGAYCVPRSDGRVVIGSTMEDAGFSKDVTLGGLRDVSSRATRLFPKLADAPVTSTWAGLRPETVDGLPALGPGLHEGLFIASGHFRNGILLAPATGLLMASILTGEAPALELGPFDPRRLVAFRVA